MRVPRHGDTPIHRRSGGLGGHRRPHHGKPDPSRNGVGLSCPVGFKNGTEGNVQIAVDAVLSASQPHHFMAITKEGRSAIATTTGNPDCHIILRGGKVPNYDAASIQAASVAAARAGVRPAMMIDASHGNSGKDADNQPRVVEGVCRQIETGERCIIGMMVESNLLAGRQDLVAGAALTYGPSITDACLGWEASVGVLERLARAAERRRLQSRDGTRIRAL